MQKSLPAHEILLCLLLKRYQRKMEDDNRFNSSYQHNSSNVFFIAWISFTIFATDIMAYNNNRLERFFSTIPFNEQDRKRFDFSVLTLNNSHPLNRYPWIVFPQGILGSPTLCVSILCNYN